MHTIQRYTKTKIAKQASSFNTDIAKHSLSMAVLTGTLWPVDFTGYWYSEHCQNDGSEVKLDLGDQYRYLYSNLTRWKSSFASKT